MMIIPRKRLRPNSFSLVETVIALWVTSFAIVGLLGLVLVGLTSSHAAIKASAQAQIVQDLVNNITQATNLTAFTSKTYDYDYEGNRTNMPSVYQVSVTKGAVNAPTVLSSSSGSTFVIRIVSLTTPGTNTSSILLATPPSQPGF